MVANVRLRRVLSAFTLLVMFLALLRPAAAGEAEPPHSASVLPRAQVPLPGPEDWWGTVQEKIRRSEYEITWQEHTSLPDLPAAYQAPNRAQGFRTYFTPAGIRVIPRTETTPSWELGLALEGYVPEGVSTVVADRYESANQRISARYVNEEEGLLQEFVLPPGQASVELAIDGDLTAHLVDDGVAVDLATASGTPVLRYGDFRAVDAARYTRAVHLNLVPGGLHLTIGASSYPVTLRARLIGISGVPEGLSPTPVWMAEGDQDNAYLGYAVGAAGDVNGDGYGDIIVGAYGYDNGQADEGRAYAFYGSASGLYLTPDWMAEGDQGGAGFGRSVSTAGDVNGDGYADVIVGASVYSNGQAAEGRAFVYYGSAAGLRLAADWTAEGEQANAFFGHTVGPAGDVNGDGYGDIAIGAPGYDNGQTEEGRVYAYYGSPAGPSTVPDWTMESDQQGAAMGWSVKTTGDVNGDGYDDLIIGAWHYSNGQSQEGRAYVYPGSPSGLADSFIWSAESDQANAEFANSVSTAGDVNGDGYADMIVGAWRYNGGQPEEGCAYVYYGSSSGPSANPDWITQGNQDSARLGFSVNTAGDVNGDGYADIIVGADYYDNDQVDEGRAYVYYGSSSGPGSTPNWAAEGDQAGSSFGISVSTAGDVDGDGYSDVIVGAHGYDNGQTDEGAAFVYHGSADGLSATVGWTAESDQAEAWLGFSVGTAGDINGDGYADVIVGARNYDNGETDEGAAFVYYGSVTGPGLAPDWATEANQVGAYMGYSVGAAGDVNGDGYADVVVGAPLYNNDQDDDGAVFLYYGSATGLSLAPGWWTDSDETGSYFAYSVGTAGDVNGDGYADIIVGAFSYSNDQVHEGRAYAYYGSPAGPSLAPDWITEGNQDEAVFGGPASTAGDVNGDGFSDVVVSATGYDNGETDEGRVYAYYGSAAGLDQAPDWIAEGNQVSADFGFSAGTAGDVNGDGYADVIVGAILYDNGQTDEGRAWIYYGSAAGLSSSADWIGESDQDGAWYAFSAGTAGDVNGDGYADIIIGAPKYTHDQVNEGAAYAYYGSATGPGTVPDWMALESDQASAEFGWQVKTAGDVNGDGYADVIVAADMYDTPAANAGKVFLYYGNQGMGRSLVPRQRLADDSAPIASLGMAGGNAFRLALLGHTPFGRARVKLEWEVKPLGTLFDGTDTQQSATWLDTGAAGVQLDELADALSWGTTSHWRARLLYHPVTTPFQAHSRWLTMPWNGWNEADLRTPQELIAGFASDSPICLGGTTVFTNTTMGPPPITYLWEFGDGSTSTETNPLHTYAAADAYTVSLAAQNSWAGDVVTGSMEILPLPVAGFAFEPAGLEVSFTNTSLNATSSLWNFGDGITSTVVNPVHSYALSGSYLVTLVASSPCGEDSMQETVTVSGGVTPTPTPTPTPTVTPTPSPTGSPTPTPTSTPGPLPTPASIYLPVVFNSHCGCFCSSTEIEPNNDHLNANGPLCRGMGYGGLPTDENDYFYFWTSGGTITVRLDSYAGGQLLLYYEEEGSSRARAVAPPYELEYSGPAGRYYVRVYTPGGDSDASWYTLWASFP